MAELPSLCQWQCYILSWQFWMLQSCTAALLYCCTAHSELFNLPWQAVQWDASVSELCVAISCELVLGGQLNGKQHRQGLHDAPAGALAHASTLHPWDAFV